MSRLCAPWADDGEVARICLGDGDLAGALVVQSVATCCRAVCPSAAGVGALWQAVVAAR
jgi:hypothetical protein